MFCVVIFAIMQVYSSSFCSLSISFKAMSANFRVFCAS